MSDNENLEEFVRFLLLRGKLENEGVFKVLETEKDVIICSIGSSFCPSSENNSVSLLERRYLNSKKNNIKAIIITNIENKNIGLLEKVCKDFEITVPIYTSFYNKLILNARFPSLKNRIHVVLSEREYKIGDFSVYFSHCNSYTIGNLMVYLEYKKKYSFFIIENFYFNFLLNNSAFIKNDFFLLLDKFISKKREKTYLITNCSNINWFSDNSLFLIKNKIPAFVNDEISFFILYDFDWLHTMELLEFSFKLKKKVVIFNKSILYVLKNTFFNSTNKKMIFDGEETINDRTDTVYIFHLNPDQFINFYLEEHLSKFSNDDIKKIRFIIILSSILGWEKKMSDLVDYLYTKSEMVTNLSKSQKSYLRLGISFNDLLILLDKLNPLLIFFTNNSYRSKEILDHLPPKKALFLDNNSYFEFPSYKTFPVFFSSSFALKKNLDLEEILIQQRKRMEKNGLLLLCVQAEILKKEIKLNKIHFEKIANSFINKEFIIKLEKKIVKLWEKISSSTNVNDNIKTIRSTIEKRLTNLIKSSFYYEFNKELDEVVEFKFLFFLVKQTSHLS